MNKLDLKLSEYEIKQLIYVLNEKIIVLDNTEFEINNDEIVELIGLKNYLIALIQNKNDYINTNSDKIKIKKISNVLYDNNISYKKRLELIEDEIQTVYI
tara:strand:+ start:34 stop:333 length:300 start_codon:yes stop_codon:yes gene_type:complete